MSLDAIESEVIQPDAVSNPTRIKARDGNGRAIRTVEQIRLDNEAAALRGESRSYQQIADIMGLSGRQLAFEMVHRAMDEVPTEGTEQLIKMELAKLDAIEQKYLEIIGKIHPYVTMSGKLVILNETQVLVDGADPELIVDDGPTIQALAGLLKVAQQRAKLLGLNAPTRTELSGVMVNITIEDRGDQAKAKVLSLVERLREKE